MKHITHESHLFETNKHIAAEHKDTGITFEEAFGKPVTEMEPKEVLHEILESYDANAQISDYIERVRENPRREADILSLTGTTSMEDLSAKLERGKERFSKIVAATSPYFKEDLTFLVKLQNDYKVLPSLENLRHGYDSLPADIQDRQVFHITTEESKIITSGTLTPKE